MTEHAIALHLLRDAERRYQHDVDRFTGNRARIEERILASEGEDLTFQQQLLRLNGESISTAQRKLREVRHSLRVLREDDEKFPRE